MRAMADWEIVTTVGSEEEASLITGFLHEAGIPAEVESLLFHQEPVGFGQLGEVRIRVPAEHLAAAQEILEAAADSADADERPDELAGSD